MKDPIELYNDIEKLVASMMKMKVGPHGDTGRQGVSGVHGLPGKQGSPDTALDIVTKLNSLNESVLDAAIIKGLEDKLSAKGMMQAYRKLPRKDKLSWTELFKEKGNPFHYYQVGASGGAASTSAGGLAWKGDWNALTNTPTLTTGSGTAGETYRVSVAGTTALGTSDYQKYWEVGDWAVKMDDGSWQRVSNAVGDESELIVDAGDADYTVLATDEIVEYKTTLTADRTATLPDGSTLTAGNKIQIWKTDSTSFKVIVDGNATDTINGLTTHTLTTQYQTQGFTWSGTQWILT